MRFFRKRRKQYSEIDPDEIFLDASNLPDFDTDQLEGHIVKPISRRSIFILVACFALIFVVFIGKVWSLQVGSDGSYTTLSEQNRLRHTTVFAERGLIFDRNGKELAWNVLNPDNPEFANRHYFETDGFGHLLGYIKYPSKDSAGFYYTEEFDGKDGVEKVFNAYLSGKNGTRIVETNALNTIKSESIIDDPSDGANLTLSIDADLQEKLFEVVSTIVRTRGFRAGASVMMDIETGEIITMVSAPEYDSQVLTDGEDDEQIKYFVSDESNLFLNRSLGGQYTPGSIMKLFVAMGALEEGLISPSRQILSTGSISIPNPYDPEKETVFNDWKAHGLVDMVQAIAVSSNVYFFEVGGGYKTQEGLGIAGIEKYARMFGFGGPTGIELTGEVDGVIPNPQWKADHFDGDDWRVGDTYNTAIGQYGFQVTPLQAARAVAALANGGVLLDPTIVYDPDKEIDEEYIPVDGDHLGIVKSGMRRAVLSGTAAGLNIQNLDIGAKTGTAETGVGKKYVNSWVVGFFPYDNPKYSFATVMERGPRGNTIGATAVMREFLDWLVVTKPGYIEL